MCRYSIRYVDGAGWFIFDNQKDIRLPFCYNDEWEAMGDLKVICPMSWEELHWAFSPCV